MVGQTLLFYVCVHVLLAPPSVLGAWSKALVLWLPFEYYYYQQILNDADCTVRIFHVYYLLFW